MNADSPLVLVDSPAPGVHRIALNRPDKRNALDMPTRLALFDAVDAALADEEARALILTGAGGMFCAGGDVLSMEGQTPASARARMARGHTFVRALAEAEKPIIAAVEGPAAGAGASVALLCDIIVAGRGAKFSFPFLRLGLIPDWGLLHTLPARVGPGRARLLLMTNGQLGAEEACGCGLVDRLTEDGEVQDTALAIASDLAAGPRAALALLKQGLALSEKGLASVLDYEAAAQVACMTGAEFVEGLAAFREKRPPRFG